MQCPLGQFAAHKGAGHARLAGVGPCENLGLLVLGALLTAQRAGHGNHVHQADAFFELGIEHDGAGHMANGPVSGFFEDGQHAREMQQDPHHDAACGQRNAGPAELAPGPHSENDDGHRSQKFCQVHRY